MGVQARSIPMFRLIGTTLVVALREKSGEKRKDISHLIYAIICGNQ